MSLDNLREDILLRQKKGLPFIIAFFTCILIIIVFAPDIPIMTKNILAFCCSCPLLPAEWIAGKKINVDIFSKRNPLGQPGFFIHNESNSLFTYCYVGF